MQSFGGVANSVLSNLLFEELLQLYLLDNVIFKMNIVISWDILIQGLVFTFTGYQGTNSYFGHLGYTGREQLRTFAWRQKSQVPYRSSLTVFRLLGYSVLELSLTL